VARQVVGHQEQAQVEECAPRGAPCLPALPLSLVLRGRRRVFPPWERRENGPEGCLHPARQHLVGAAARAPHADCAGVGTEERQLAVEMALYIVAWRMPADPCPAVACFNDKGVIHVQGSYGCPSCWSQTNDLTAILAPTEVFTPSLLVRMKQRHALVCQRVLGLHLRTLEFVTGMAGHAQVFQHRLTASSFWKNVVDYQTCTRDGGQAMTIGTPVAGFGHYTLAQGPGDAPSRHLGLCNSSGEGM